MVVKVEPATPHDLPAMMRLMQHLSDAHAGLSEVFGPADDWYESTRRMFLDRLGARDHYLATAKLGRQTAGMVTAMVRHVPGFKLHRRAVIENLVVDPEHRRAGVGRALVEAAVAWCERRGVQCFELSVAADNDAARAFWEALGFQAVVVRMHRRAGGRPSAVVHR